MSKRLQTIADLVDDNSIVADVGSDHALLPCFLLIENKAQKAYAIDNKQGPINSAKNTIAEYQLEQQVIPVLSDGLRNMPYDDFDTIIIAGMGFDTIEAILTTNLSRFKDLKYLIIQSNTKIKELRRWILKQNYLICEEVLVKDKNKFYFIIKIDIHKSIDYTKEDLILGPILRKDRENKTFKDYLKLKIESLEHIGQFKSSSSIEEELKILRNHYKILE